MSHITGCYCLAYGCPKFLSVHDGYRYITLPDGALTAVLFFGFAITGLIGLSSNLFRYLTQRLAIMLIMTALSENIAVAFSWSVNVILGVGVLGSLVCPVAGTRLLTGYQISKGELYLAWEKKDALKDKVILVVDDETDVLEAVEEKLNMCLIHKAPGYDTALQYLLSYTYDILILDIYC